MPRNGTYPTVWFNYSQDTPLSTKFAQVVSWLENGFDLTLLYHHEPDSTGHTYGPDSQEMYSMLESIDNDFGTFISNLSSKGLLDKVTIIQKFCENYYFSF